MAKPSAKPKDYPVSREWFRRRAKISRAKADDIIEKAKSRAAIIANKSQLDLLLHVLREGDKAKAGGKSFEEFKVKMAESVRLRWGPNGDKVLNLFRAEVQGAYIKGRMEEMSTPEAVREKPFWRFTSILDAVTTPICTSCHGTVLPANHKWWLTHTPPLHHFCRSVIINATTTQAKALGVTKRPPRIKPDVYTAASGEEYTFGQGAQYQPDLSKMPKEFRRSFNEKVARVEAYFKLPKSKRRAVNAPPIKKPDGYS